MAPDAIGAPWRQVLKAGEGLHTVPIHHGLLGLPHAPVVLPLHSALAIHVDHVPGQFSVHTLNKMSCLGAYGCML